MKEIVDLLQDKKLIFKSLTPIDIKALGSRKKMTIYLGVNLKKYYAAIFSIEKKSRVLQKEVNEFIALHQRLESYNDSKINYKYIHIKAPLCSKAKKLLEENGWIVWHQEL
jgi:uncharacterized protein Veg